MTTTYEEFGMITSYEDFVMNTRYSLSGLSYKILQYFISKIKPYDNTKENNIEKIDRTVLFRISEIGKEMIGTESSALVKKQIMKGLDDIMTSRFWSKKDVDGRSALIGRTWIQHIQLDEKCEYGKLIFSDVAIPYLLNMKENFTNDALEEIREFKGLETGRIYEMIMSQKYKETFILDLKDLLWSLQLDKTNHYKEYRRFNEKFLAEAIKEINEYTLITVTYKPIGHPTECISFTVKEKSDEEKERVLQQREARSALFREGSFA